MAAAWKKTVMAVVVLSASLCAAAHGSVVKKSIDENLPPRKSLPEKISHDPVEHGLKGWKKFGSMTVKGDEEAVLKAAARYGAEAVAIAETEIISGGGYGYTYKGSRTESYGRVDTYKREAQDVKFSGGYDVELYRRVEPDPLYAFDHFGDYYWVSGRYRGVIPSIADPDTLKQILALGRVDVNRLSDNRTALIRVVGQILNEMHTEEKVSKYDKTSPAVIDPLIATARFLLDEGADPDIRCGEKRDTTALDLVASALRWSIEQYGDCTSQIGKFADWRELGAPMTAGHIQAALLELKGLLMKGGAAAKASEKTVKPDSKTGAVEEKKETAPRKRKRYASAPSMTIDKGKQYIATIQTTKGAIVFDLFAKDAPVSVNNFVFLAREGHYDATSFHRLEPGLFIQGGDPDPLNKTGSGGGPGYTIPLELSPRKHTAGSLSMATAGPKGSGSQFFITFSAQAYLDGNDKYPVFGEVISGMDVLKKLVVGDVIVSMTIQEK
jgi:peptidyl-prolyl cis-trans isomerase B (cyclophilin B)